MYEPWRAKVTRSSTEGVSASAARRRAVVDKLSIRAAVSTVAKIHASRRSTTQPAPRLVSIHESKWSASVRVLLAAGLPVCLSVCLFLCRCRCLSVATWKFVVIVMVVAAEASLTRRCSLPASSARRSGISSQCFRCMTLWMKTGTTRTRQRSGDLACISWIGQMVTLGLFLRLLFRLQLIDVIFNCLS